jgi:MFS family permease
VFIVAGVATMALAPGFAVLCIGRLIFSIGMNAHLVGAPKLVGNWFAGRRELGFAMGLYTLAFTAGVFLSLNVLGRVGEAQGWRPAVTLLVLLSLVGFVLVATVPGAPLGGRAGTTPASTEFRPFTLPLGAWVLAIAYFGYSIGTEGYLTFAPDYLVRRGLQLSVASSAIGAYALIAFVLKPVLAGFLRPRLAIGYVVAATLVALASVALLFAATIPPTVSSAVFGVSLALGMPAFLALPHFVLPPEHVGQGYGLYQLFYSFGFVAQPVVGAAVDRAGGYAPGFMVIALYTLLGLAVALPIVQRLPGAPTTGD